MATKETKPATQEVLPSRIHFNQFVMITKLSELQRAGFRAYTGYKDWMRQEEWQQLLDSYLGNK